MNKFLKIPKHTFSNLLLNSSSIRIENKILTKESQLALIKENVYSLSCCKKFNYLNLSYIERNIDFKKSSTKSFNIYGRLTLTNYVKNIYLEENFYNTIDNSNQSRIYTKENYDVLLKDFDDKDNNIIKWNNQKNDNFYLLSYDSPEEIRNLYKEISILF